MLSGRGSSSKPCAPVRAQYKRGMTLGEWCDENGEYGDKLMEEWYDPDRTVDEVTRGNHIQGAVEVLGGMHVGRGAIHVGGNGEQSHQY